MKMHKKSLDEVIRLTRKYHKTGDKDLLSSLNDAARRVIEEKHWLEVSEIVHGCLRLKPYATNETIYNVFTALGLEVIDDAEDILPEFV